MKYNELSSAIKTCTKHKDWGGYHSCPFCRLEDISNFRVDKIETFGSGELIGEYEVVAVDTKDGIITIRKYEQ